MNKSKLFISLIMFVAIVGCGSTPEWPWTNDNIDSLCKLPDQCTDLDALKAFNQASEFCRSVQNYYEASGFNSGATKTGVGITGALAGAVAAPIAEGTAKTAWAGLSGATNGIQLSVEEAFSTSLAVKRRDAVAKAANAGAKKFQDETASSNKKIEIAINMARDCATSPAETEQAALKAMGAAEISAK